MPEENINLEDDKLENKDIDNEQEAVEDEVVDDVKQEPAEDPYDKKLSELEKDNKRKGTALIEKNKKIQDLKEDLENQGFDEDKVSELVDERVREAMGGLGDFEETKKELSEQLEITKKNNIDSALSKVADNSGAKKIYKHFFDTQVNKDLPFEGQINQAKILGDAAMSDDKFQADVAKANENNINTSGKVREDGEVLSGDEKAFSNELFQTKEGKAEFERLRKSN